MQDRIRKCAEEDSALLADVIRTSFGTVAERFGLTPANAPRHPSNCTAEWIRDEMRRGTSYFILEVEGQAAGCVGLEQPGPDVCYLERLAVLPENRRRGFGRKLVAHVLAESKCVGAVRVEIGIIAEDEELKSWYQKIGFSETGIKRYPHLPFTVCFLSKTLGSVLE